MKDGGSEHGGDPAEPRGRSGERPVDAGKQPTGAGTLVCELCGGPVLDRHCKIVCLNCGYQRDCSDP